MNLNSGIFYFGFWRRVCLVAGIIFTTIIVIRMTFFLRNSIEPEKHKVTEWLSRHGFDIFI